MSAATDTLRTAETLTEAGVPERQAAAHAKAIDTAAGEAVGELVTRADLYRALLIHTAANAAIVGALLALFRFLFPPAP